MNNHPFIFLIGLVVVSSVCLPLAPFWTDPVPLEATATLPPVTPTQTKETVEPSARNPLVVHFIDVGRGDAILVVSPGGGIALIDGGDVDSGVVAYLGSQGVERIDLMIATHPHEDHINGLIQVLEAMPVAGVVTNGQAHTTEAYESFLDAILNSEAEYIEVSRGDILALGGLELSVLHPDSLEGDLNGNSIVLRLTYYQTTIILMGDAGFEAEPGILAAGLPLKANILKVGHHGSCAATSVTFLNAVQPEVAIYSTGVDNPYGLPCDATLNKLTQVGAVVLGTDVNGSIIVRVTEDGYRINTEDGQEFGR